MTPEYFISLLTVTAVASSLGIEIIKKVLDNLGVKYKTMPLAVLVAFGIGVVRMLCAAPVITTDTCIYAVYMGIANAIGATIGYDQVNAFIRAMTESE